MNSITQNTLQSWDLANTIFLRIVAICFMVFAAQYWMQLSGISNSGIMRFDLLPSPWKVAAVTLAILHPITALGLWGLFSWGIAIWTINIAVQVLMHGFFPEVFGANVLLLVFHGVTFASFVIFQIALHYKLSVHNSQS